eukprot:SAG11_NODE_8614_length_995_cov_1.891741_2_plen_183_part_00
MEGQNAYHFIGKQPPPLPKSASIRPSDRDFPELYGIEVSNLYPSSEMKPNVVIRNVREHGDSNLNPRVTIVDSQAPGLKRVLRTGEDGTLQPTGEYIRVDEQQMLGDHKAPSAVQPSDPGLRPAEPEPESGPTVGVNVPPPRGAKHSTATPLAGQTIKNDSQVEDDIVRLGKNPKTFVGHRV